MSAHAATLDASWPGSDGGARELAALVGETMGSSSGRVAFRRDLSQPQFAPGNGARVAELLRAIPLVKGTPLAASPKTSANAAYKLLVSIHNATAPTAPAYYDNTSSVTALTDELAAATTYYLARLGHELKPLVIDSAAGAPGSANSPTWWQLRSALVSILRKLDTTIARGTGTGNPPDFVGLAELATTLSRTETTSASLEKDVRKALSAITPTGAGAGEGPDCLIGSAGMLRALMATNTGITGASGWRLDPRTGRTVYHYLGVPFYRADVAETVNGTVSTLFAANLGPTGLFLVCGYGEPETFGLELTATPNYVATGQREMILHGAFALAVHEKEAIYAITNVSIAAQ